jgi:hypothetical protein
VIDVGDVEVVAVGDRLGVLPALLDECVNLSDADPPTTDVRFAQVIVSDPSYIAFGNG